MKKKPFLVGSIIILSVLLVGYWYFVHLRPLPSVQAAFIMPVDEYGVIAPDGTFMYTSLQTLIDLQTGVESSNDPAYQLKLDVAWPFLHLSPDGRYLTAKSVEDRNHNYLLDMKEKTYQEDSYLCKSWSGDSTRCVEVFDGQLIEMPANKVIEGWNRKEDFRKLSNVSGDATILWDMKRKIPVAHIINKGMAGKLSLASYSYDQYNPDPEHAIILPILEIQPPREIVSFVFDPSGQYILLAVWEHEGEYQVDDYDTSTVTDTVLILVDWRAKENKEIFRISSIDPKHVAVSRGAGSLEWSSDGSTILVYRYYAPAVVLKIKYP